MEKVSIVIPVHNSSKYLDKCLNSVLNQTYKNIEVICIENGSKDNSLKILNKYKNQIKIYILDKSGISLARNEGIKHATGEYLYFLDSDDYVERDLIEKLVDKLERTNSDLCYCKYYSEYENKSDNKIKTILYTFDIIDKKDFTSCFHKITFGPTKLFKTKIIKLNKIEFPLDLKYEDVPFVLEYISKSSKIAMVDEYLYSYVIHSNSETTTIDNKVYDMLEIVKLCEQIYSKNELTSFVVKLLTTMTIKQRYQKDKTIRKEFINTAFDYLNVNYRNWRKCEYFISRNKAKVLIEKNKLLTKTYCLFYNVFSKILEK